MKKYELKLNFFKTLIEVNYGKNFKYLKWACPSLIVGVICMFIAYFIPEGAFKTPLFIFGAILSCGYSLMLYFNVYKPLKKDNE